MLTERHLTDERDHATFAAAYERVGGFPLSADSIRNSRVVGFYLDGTLVGGYIINESAPFRALQDMPSAEAERVKAESGAKELFEVSCVWMEPALRRTVHGNNMWLYVVRVYIVNRNRSVVVSTVNESLRRFYEDFGFTVRYSGVIDMPDGSQLPKYVFTLDSLTPLIVACFRFGYGRYSRALATSLNRRVSDLGLRPSRVVGA